MTPHHCLPLLPVADCRVQCSSWGSLLPALQLTLAQSQQQRCAPRSSSAQGGSQNQHGTRSIPQPAHQLTRQSSRAQMGCGPKRWEPAAQANAVSVAVGGAEAPGRQCQMGYRMPHICDCCVCSPAPPPFAQHHKQRLGLCMTLDFPWQDSSMLGAWQTPVLPAQCATCCTTASRYTGVVSIHSFSAECTVHVAMLPHAQTGALLLLQTLPPATSPPRASPSSAQTTPTSQPGRHPAKPLPAHPVEKG